MRKFNIYYLILAFLTIIYAAFVYYQPLGSNGATTQFALTATQARILSLTILIPQSIIWYIAFYGFIKVKEYAALIEDSKDGAALRILGNGLMLLAISLPLNALAGTVRTFLNSRYSSLTEETTIAFNYFSLVLTLGGIWLVAYGARRLSKTLEKRTYTLTQKLSAVAFLAFAVFYTYVALNDPFRATPSTLTGTAAYYMPDALIFATVVVPRICSWYLGFRAAYDVHLYRMRVPGVLYRRALGLLAAGIACVVISLMALRLTTSLTTILDSLTLRYLLVFVYTLLVIIGASYGLIAAGAKRLKKIEEV